MLCNLLLKEKTMWTGCYKCKNNSFQNKTKQKVKKKISYIKFESDAMLLNSTGSRSSDSCTDQIWF